MLTKNKFHRNTIVIAKNGTLYGRIWRRIDSEHIQVIDSGSYINIYHESEVKVTDYKGYRKLNKENIFIHMTSLRKLKKQASAYNPHFGGRGAFGAKWTKEQKEKALAITDKNIKWFDLV